MSRIAAALRTATWLSPDRATAYARILAVFMAAGLAYDLLSTALGHHPFRPATSPMGKPAATDFLAFWAAGREVWAGHPTAAYDPASLIAIEHASAILDPGAFLAFFYPPTFLLLCLPFAALPYLAGFAAFTGISLTTLIAGLHRILASSKPNRASLLPILAFPGLLMNAATGQTGFWTASCFAWALLWLERRPALAGACLGMLAIKPHLALPIPVALIAARRWRSLAAFAATAATWATLSWAILGTATWRAFLSSAPAIRDALQNHREDWDKLQSLFTTTRILGGSLTTAYLAQALLAVAILTTLALTASRRPGAGAEIAAITAAAMLCTPHILDYDLAAIGVPLAWLAGQAARTVWLPWEKTLAGLAFLWPLLARLATQSGAAPIAPLILLGLFALVCRRAWQHPPQACRTTQAAC